MSEGQPSHEPLVAPENEVRANVTPAISHVALTSVEHSFADPDSRDFTDEQKASWMNAKPDALKPALDAANEVSWESRHAADKGDTRAFDERNKEWNEGFRSAVNAMMKEEGLDAAVHGERKLAFSALGIELSEDKENGLYKEVEAFRKKYVAEDTSDINRFIKDLSYGCDTKDDGIVNLSYLEQRLEAIAPLLVVFGTDKNAHQLVADFAIARGMLTQKETNKKALADQMQSQMKKKPSTEEHVRLKALHEKMAERDTKTQPPTDTAKEKENQENISIRINGESIAGDGGKNQDAIWFDEENKAALVCDGLGGHGDGEKAAQSVRDSLKQSLSAVPKFATHVEAQQWLQHQILNANTQLGEAKTRTDNPIAQDAGTTLSASFVWESPEGKQILITGNLGDSRISVIREDTVLDVTLDQGMNLYHLMENPSKPGEYLLGPDGKPMADKTKPRSIQDAIQLQKKFSAIEDPDTLTGEEAALWKIRNRIDASVNGASIENNLLMGAFELQVGDRILLRSDGLTDVMSDDRTLKALKDKNDPKSASDALLQGATEGDQSKRAKGYSDDKSVIVMDIGQATIESEGVDSQNKSSEEEMTFGEIGAAKTIKNEKGKEHEDRMLFDPEGHVFGVFDGLGGHGNGDKAAQLARDFISEAASIIPNNITLEETTKRLQRLTMEMNDVVAKGGEGGMTTASIGYIWTSPEGEKKLISINVGDSRLYRLRNNELDAMTVDSFNPEKSREEQKARQDKFSSIDTSAQYAALPKSDRIAFGMRHMIDAAIGGTPITPDINIYDIAENDVYFFSSDGIHDNLTDSQIQDILRAHPKPDDAVQKLVSEALTRSRRTEEPNTGKSDPRRKKDDITGVVIKMTADFPTRRNPKQVAELTIDNPYTTMHTTIESHNQTLDQAERQLGRNLTAIEQYYILKGNNIDKIDKVEPVYKAYNRARSKRLYLERYNHIQERLSKLTTDGETNTTEFQSLSGELRNATIGLGSAESLEVYLNLQEYSDSDKKNIMDQYLQANSTKPVNSRTGIQIMFRKDENEVTQAYVSFQYIPITAAETNSDAARNTTASPENNTDTATTDARIEKSLTELGLDYQTITSVIEKSQTKNGIARLIDQKGELAQRPSYADRAVQFSDDELNSVDGLIIRSKELREQAVNKTPDYQTLEQLVEERRKIHGTFMEESFVLQDPSATTAYKDTDGKIKAPEHLYKLYIWGNRLVMTADSRNSIGKQLADGTNPTTFGKHIKELCGFTSAEKTSQTE
ncbi:MAG: protein phosphatase 2C domain-containing protein [Candidatus Levybacteria bacterium]|nr:protein phosphatase 2C domain-containing protein [Candidatus Levybacteria bacterium]